MPGNLAYGHAEAKHRSRGHTQISHDLQFFFCPEIVCVFFLSWHAKRDFSPLAPCFALCQVAMSAATTLIGEGSLRVGKALDQPDIPRKLSVVSSFVAITIGAVWLAKAAFF